MIKRLISFCVILSMCMLRVSAFDVDSLSAECAVVLNVHTGEVLLSKNSEVKHSMASTTKIMTALLAIESGKLQSEIIVTEDMLKVEGTSMGLLPGDSVSLNELIYGMMLSSGNDAANSAAIYLSGDIEKFSLLMNEKAKSIGMNNTSFVTPSGLDADGHFSTAYDMALLGAEAVRNPKFASVCSTKTVTVSYGNPPYLRTLYNHNKLLDSYDFALGIKTGFTKKSGRCLVSYAKKDGAELVAVTLNAPDDWNDHIRMLDYSFESLNTFEKLPDLPESVLVVGGSGESVDIEVSPCIVCTALDSVSVETKIFIERFVYAPVQRGTIVGRCEYYIGEKCVQVEPILITESVT